MIRCLLTLVLLCSSLVSFSQSTKINVIDQATNKPISGAAVSGRGIIAIPSGDDGSILVSKSAQMDSIIELSSLGYQTLYLDAATTLAKSTFTVTMDQTSVKLGDVIINGRASNNVFKALSQLDIHLRPINNSQEILRMVPGLFIGQHAGGGKSEQIFLRGFDIDHGTDINLSVDGMPVNMVSHAHGQGYADLHFVIPEMVDEVQFNKGPYFADKGNYSTAGNVALKTKTFLDQNFVKLEAGQYKTGRAVLGVNLLPRNTGSNPQSLILAGEASYTNGYFVAKQDFTRFNGMLKYFGKISPKSSLTAIASGFTSKWLASGQIPDRAVASGLIGFYGALDSTEGGQTSRYNANVKLRTDLDNGAILENRVFYTKNDFELYSNFTFFKEDPINGDQIRQAEDRNMIGYNGSYTQAGQLGKLPLKSVIGAFARYDDVDNLELSRTKNRTITTDRLMLGHVKELDVALYVNEQLKLNPKLDLTLGVRADYFHNIYEDYLNGGTKQSGTALLSPNLKLDYKLSPSVQLYLYGGKGFHSNDTRVVVQEGGRKTAPPAYGADLGGIFKLGDRVLLQSSLWYLYLQQEFVYVGDEGVVEPSGRTQRMGIDASVRYQITKKLFADVDLNVANPRALNVPKEESYLPLAPIFTSTGGLTYRSITGFNGSLRYRYMAPRPANEDYSVTAEGYFVTDLQLNYTRKRFELGVSVQNLFNTKWKETQFDTESRLQSEPNAVSEIHFTPGTPFLVKVSLSIFF